MEKESHQDQEKEGEEEKRKKGAKNERVDSNLLAELKNIVKSYSPEQEEEKQQNEEKKDQTWESIITIIAEEEKALKKKISEELSEFKEKVEKKIEEAKKMKNSSEKEEENERKNSPMEKEIKISCSLLTTMMNRQKDIKTIYHMILGFMIVLFCQLLCKERIESHYWLDYDLWIFVFHGGYKFWSCWLFLFAYSMGVIIIVLLIKTFKIPNKIWIPVVGVYTLSFYYFGLKMVSENDIGFGFKLALIIETVRMSMKAYSYFRNKMLYGNGPNKFSSYVPS